MKHWIIGILIAVSFLSCDEVFAQRDYETVTQDSGSYVSDAFRMEDGYYFTGLSTPDLKTGNDTIWFLTSYDKTNWDTLKYGNAKYVEFIDTVSNNYALDFKKVLAFEWWKIATDSTETSDKSWIVQKTYMGQ